jgi:hypothetical protein
MGLLHNLVALSTLALIAIVSTRAVWRGDQGKPVHTVDPDELYRAARA